MSLTIVVLIRQNTSIFEKIISYLKYEEISRLRLVCKDFDKTCKKKVTEGFHSVCHKIRSCHRRVTYSRSVTCVLLKTGSMLYKLEEFINDLGMIGAKIVDECHRILRLAESREKMKIYGDMEVLDHLCQKAEKRYGSRKRKCFLLEEQLTRKKWKHWKPDLKPVLCTAGTSTRPSCRC